MKAHKVTRHYQFQESAMFAIQGITGQQTHEIMTTLIDVTDKMLDDSTIDITLSVGDQWNGNCYSYQKRLKKHIFYPETKLYIGCYLKYEDTYGRTASELTYDFKFPTKLLNFSEKELDDIMTDGILCDVSKEIELTTTRDSLTKEQKEINKLKSNLKAKENRKKSKVTFTP